MNERTYKIKLELTVDQLQTLIQHAESEKEKALGLSNDNDWSKVRDQLAYELDMITDYPWNT